MKATVRLMLSISLVAAMTITAASVDAQSMSGRRRPEVGNTRGNSGSHNGSVSRSDNRGSNHGGNSSDNNKGGGNHNGGGNNHGGNNGGSNYNNGGNNGGSNHGGSNRGGGNRNGGNNGGNNGGSNYNHSGNNGGSNYNHGGNNGGSNRGGGNRNGGGSSRPDVHHPGGNHGNHRPDVHRSGGHSYSPGTGPRHDWRTPMRPPHRPHRPARIVWHRPPVPHGYRPYHGAPVIDRILGLTFGTLYSTSLDYLYNNGYVIDGYDTDIVYLRDVTIVGTLWPDAMLNYDTAGRLSYAQFYYSTGYLDHTRYNRVYRDLCAVYGPPIEVAPGTVAASATWFGGNTTGYVTLSLSNTDGRCYTSLTVGL